MSGSSRRTTRDLAKVRRHVDTLVRGRVYTPGSLPPNIVAQPWTRMTAIDVDVVKDKTYTLKDLAEVICAQAGLFIKTDKSETFLPVEFKIFSIASWTEATHISLYPQDIVTGNKTELVRADGSAAKNQWARAGYVYPASFSNVTFNSGNTTQMAEHFYTVNCASSARLETHIGVMWRSANTKVISLGYQFKTALHYGAIPRPTVDDTLEIEIHQHHQESDERGSDAPSIEDVFSEVRALREEMRNLKPAMK